MELHTIGIDLGKTVFHLVGLRPRGEVVVDALISAGAIPLERRTQVLYRAAEIGFVL